MESKKASAAKLKAEGNAFFKASKFEEALAKYNEACNLCPTVPAYWSNAAVCHEKLKAYPNMKEAAERCIQADATFAKGYYRLAVAQRELGELTESLESIQKGLELKQSEDDFRLLKLDVEDRVDVLRCQNCGNPETSSICGKCRSASYCSAACQKTHWKVHKSACVAISEGFDSCMSCNKRMAPKSRLLCPKCGHTSYCSRQCLLANRAQHRSVCESNQLCKASSSGSSTHDHALLELFQAWKQLHGFNVAELATHYMTKKQFLTQPPDFMTVVQLRFNYNFLSFLPMKEPEVVLFRDMHPEQRTSLLNHLRQSVSFETRYLGHLFSITAFDGDRRLPFDSIKPFMMEASDYRGESRDKIMSTMRFKTCLNVRVLESWQVNQCSRNMHAQLTALQSSETQGWSVFTFHAFRMCTSEPLHRTHALIVDFDYGFELGEIEALTKYELVTLESMRSFHRKKQKQGQMEPTYVNHVLLNVLDTENSPHVRRARSISPRAALLAVFVRGNESMRKLLPLEGQIVETAEPGDVNLMSSKQCDEKAKESFRRLKSVSLPKVTSPDLSGVKPDAS